ncbi:MAG: efflux RND transporter periplasmic adaptor subunit [Verrucomicrobiota bacterium]|nr:efflux RND transporter periplasmic adaptor subunit [Verrucomicrobiota bacterium]
MQLPTRFSALGLIAASLIFASCQRSTDVVSGTIEVDEVHVASRAAGRVQKIFAREGQALKAGDPIVQLDAAELPAQRNLAQAQVDAASHDVEAQQAQLQFLQSDAKRQQELLRNHTVSPNEAERATSAANAQAKNIESAQMRVTQARANLAQIETQLDEMKVLSPGDTVLEILSVKVGDVLAPNREVATLIIPSYFWVRVYVPEPWLGRIKLGDEVRVHVDSFRSEEFRGVVEQINRQAEFTPRNVQTVEDRIRQVFGVKIRLENRDDKLRAGMSADITFPNVPKKG